MKRKIVRVAMALLVVSAGLVGTTGNVAASHDCSTLDALVYGFTFGHVNNKCVENHGGNALEEYSATDTEQTKVDIYSSIKTQQDSINTYGNTFDNYLNDTETVAWSKMQVAVAEAYKNGATKSQAKFEAEKAFEEYYSVKQRNLIAEWNNFAATHDRAVALAKSDGNISMDEETGFMRINDVGTGGSAFVLNNMNTTVNVTLANGTVVEAREIGSNYMKTTVNRFTKTDSKGNYENLRVEKPTTSFDSSILLSLTQFHSRWDRITQKKNSLVSESDNFVNATYDAYEAGEINASDVISANTAMFEYGTATGDDNSSIYNSWAALAAMGFDVPNLNSTGTMRISYNNNTYEGLVLARNIPNGTWESGKTYNATNITGPVFMATTSGEKIDLQGNFTVTKITSKEGSEIQSVDTKKYNYKTSNTTELQESINDLTKLSQEIDDRQAEIVNSGSGGGGSTLSLPAWLTEKYAGIPLWGILTVALGGLYVFGSSRKN